jgi:hypothetical protein
MVDPGRRSGDPLRWTSPQGMASPVLDVGIYSRTEQQTMLTAAKAEYLKRMTGRVTQGASAAQSYGMTVMTTDDLIRLMNGLASALGLDNVAVTVSPNFNPGYGVPNAGYPVTD